VERLTVDALEWAVAARAYDDAAGSGDGWVVEPIPEGALIAGVDGAGHGAEALEVARIATRLLRAFAPEPPVALVARCHAALRSSRGAALSLASIDSRRNLLTWVGVGNVAGVLVRSMEGRRAVRERLIPGAGIVGRRVPPLTTAVIELRIGDTVVFATDGVQAEFGRGVRAQDPPQQTADRIIARHATGADDALVIVARYLGGPA
jgi:negative regulator of sigma-B (phosphoserine phosphatase)